MLQGSPRVTETSLHHPACPGGTARGASTSGLEVIVLRLGLSFVCHSDGDGFQRVGGRRRVMRSRTRVKSQEDY